MHHLAAGALGNALVLAAGDERLSAAYAVEDKLLTAHIQFAQHIVQQQDRVLARFVKVNFTLGKLYRQCRRPRLTLTCKAACVLTVYRDDKIVLVSAGETLLRLYLRRAVALLMLAQVVEYLLRRAERISDRRHGAVLYT